jgi:hypothetical protein
MTDDLASDLREHIHKTWANVPAAERRRSHWVMNPEWYIETRKCDTVGPAPYLPSPGHAVLEPETLFRRPIEVRENGGVPHLEPDAGHAAKNGYLS